MTASFLDTSALAKRYLVEAGSAWMRSWIAPAAGNVILISDLGVLEMLSVLERRKREGSLSASDVRRLEADFTAHVAAEYVVAPLDKSVLQLAQHLLRGHPLRALDAIQLASASRASQMLGEPLTFVSGDRSLLAVAAAEGFATDDPNAHP